MFILDTNTLIYFFKGMGGVSQRLLATPPSEIGIPTIVVYELEVGIAKSRSPSKRRAQLDVITGLVSILSFGREEAMASARLRAGLERAGSSIGPMDTLIAGTALSQGAVLVSRNLAEFERIRDLRVENWF
jgi:tRNA(fMet)-specific endonuclease VapC